MFQDVGIASGVALPHMKFLCSAANSWIMTDDGWPTCWLPTGPVQLAAALEDRGATYKERKQLLHNEGNGAFKEIGDTARLGDLGHSIGRARFGNRGDYDNDGRMDALFNSQNGPAELFHNQDRSGNHWVSFKTVGTKSNRDGFHARSKLTAGRNDADCLGSRGVQLSFFQRPQIILWLGAAAE